MRPLRLELKGFTAFREPAEIDFGALDVFAISGPTGSGKSSLLDAMTYALFGRVERVGDGVKQLISQGLPRMAVTLEFEVGHDRYRVTRSTPANKGATKILLERRDSDGQWKQAGDGADRVREAEAMLRALIGLTYDGFTRSVLLPQGKFAEFLVGDAKKRRDILTELLGLVLFRRLAERAGAVAKESAVRAQERTLSLEREYEAVTPEALKDAKRQAKEAKERERNLGIAAEAMLEILGRWKDSARAGDELRRIRDEAAQAAPSVADSVRELTSLAEALDEAESAVASASAAHEEATARLEAAESALRQADASLGDAAELDRARVVAHSLADAIGARTRATTRMEQLHAQADALASTLGSAEGSVAERRAAVATLEAEVAAAQAALAEARHADLVAAVSAGLKAGDPCPVCGEPLRRAPRRAKGSGLEEASGQLRMAGERRDAAAADLAEAERAAAEASKEVQINESQRQTQTQELAELDRAIEDAGTRLAAILGDPLPQDPMDAIEGRARERQALASAEREAAREEARCAQTAFRAEQERDRVIASVERHRHVVAADLGSLLQRAARAMDPPPALRIPDRPEEDGPAAMAAFGFSVAEALSALVDAAERALTETASVEDRLLAEATERLGDLVEPADSLEALGHAVNAAFLGATAFVATSAKGAEDLALRLDRKRELASDIQDLERRARLFRTLAQELRADRLIAFLQAEALQLLATAGSARLGGLSDGRYRLICRDDEFLVVDTWNGDEERSVRTLSGGETFLASLALSLALADQVRSLSVTDRARLDSLFLDEGFGTLDPETLRTVTDAIEVLAGDGRLVGVVTHVKELAEQFPRVEVRKDRIGSRLQLVS